MEGVTVMTAQEIFDKVVRGLAGQGWEPSSTELLGCAYRGDNGLRCAAGHLIADEHYDPAFEGNSVVCSRVLEALERSGVDANDVGLVDDLQAAHDNNYIPRDIRAAVETVCINRGLTWPTDVPR